MTAILERPTQTTTEAATPRGAADAPTTATPSRRPTNTRLSVAHEGEAVHTRPTSEPNPIAHLSAEQIEELGRELDAIREEVLASRGAADAAYIRRVIAFQRGLELGSRGLLLFSRHPAAWAAGALGLSIAKILDNMEIGHNIIHGQWDWMRDPKIHSSTWEWDNTTPASAWKHSHNEIHHTWTNVVGKDNDLGYGIMRVDHAQKWYPVYLAQPLLNMINATVFEYSIAAYDLELAKNWKTRKQNPEFQANAKPVVNKIKAQAKKDYLLWPLLSGPNFLPTLAANVTANVARNYWTHSVIMCGHFPKGVQTFTKDSIEGETRGEWYLRQMLGSANITGSKAMHMMTGNLSFQIEHHIFPDLPSNRYAEISPRVQEIFQRYGLTYVTGSLPKQVFSAWQQIFEYSLPNDTTPTQGLKILATSGIKGLKARARKTRYVTPSRA